VTSERKKEAYEDTEPEHPAASKLLKLGLISVSSAVIGGLAAAWWYRKTLTKLQNPIIQEDLQKSESQNGPTDDTHF
jgi:hypothetical protein